MSTHFTTMKIWTILVGSTFIPLILLTWWAMSMKRGAGPQGGEILFLGYIALWMWMIVASMVTTTIYTSALSSSGFMRFAAIPLGLLIALIVFISMAASVLNHASLSELSDAQSKLENLLAFGLQAAIIGANLWALCRKM